MTRPRRSPSSRFANLVNLVFSAVLGLTLIAFTAAGTVPHDHLGLEEHAQSSALSSGGTHHGFHDGQPDDHIANALCWAACAISVAAFADRTPDIARARGVPPARMARMDEHSPDDPLPPPRPAVKI
jgi:hypothetical protein